MNITNVNAYLIIAMIFIINIKAMETLGSFHGLFLWTNSVHIDEYIYIIKKIRKETSWMKQLSPIQLQQQIIHYKSEREKSKQKWTLLER